IVSPGSATATCRPNSLRCFRFKRPLSNRSKVDILRFAMAYSSSLNSDPGSARLAKKLQTLQRGRAGPFSRHWPATNQCIAAAEVMLLNGHKAPTVHRPLLAARVLSRLKARGRRRFKFLAQYIATQGTRLLSRNFRSPTRESALRVLLFRGFSGMKTASLTRVEHTTARRLLRAVRSVLRCDSFSWLR